MFLPPVLLSKRCIIDSTEASTYAVFTPYGFPVIRWANVRLSLILLDHGRTKIFFDKAGSVKELH